MATFLPTHTTLRGYFAIYPSHFGISELDKETVICKCHMISLYTLSRRGGNVSLNEVLTTGSSLIHWGLGF